MRAKCRSRVAGLVALTLVAALSPAATANASATAVSAGGQTLTAQGAAAAAVAANNGARNKARENKEEEEAERELLEQFGKDTKSTTIGLLDKDTLKKGFRFHQRHESPFKFDRGLGFYRVKPEAVYGGDAEKDARTDMEYRVRVDGDVQPVLVTLVAVAQSDAKDAKRVEEAEKQVRVDLGKESLPAAHRVWEIKGVTLLNDVPEGAYIEYKRYLDWSEREKRVPALTLEQFVNKTKGKKSYEYEEIER